MDPSLLTLTSEHLTVVVAVGEGMPAVVSCGPSAGGWNSMLHGRAVPHASMDDPTWLGVLAEHAAGHGARPGLVGARPDGTAWSPVFRTIEVTEGEATASVALRDDIAALSLQLRFAVAETLVIQASIVNDGDTPYGLQRLAAGIEVPARADELLSFSGRWCREFQVDRRAFEGLTVVENRRGRTSHQRLPAIIAGPTGFGEEHGELWSIQSAWSGNAELAAERLGDGRRYLQAGELLQPGEVSLAPGAAYAAPDVVVAWSPAGATGLAQAHHRHVRANLPATTARPRPVVLNTWEAVYFEHRFDTLAALAERAAAVGVERFVLDDGWFGGRRDDTAGLGDWWVSEAVWPDGLTPLIDHVGRLGMEFGLWVEPEMVNPDSDLHRAHPDWTLTTPGYDAPLARQQLVLDFGRPEVRDHIVEALSRLLLDLDIAFLKWDMNRDIVQGSHEGRAGTHSHVTGLYEVLDLLRARFPDVEIESCASGGGRADLGILGRTDRIWTSDCNDAVERQLIQRGFGLLFPPEVMGAHIGPARAHTTRRRQGLGFRAATALFGHLGVEWNLLDATDDELERLTATIAEHKRLRPTLHGGDVFRVDHPDPAALVHGVVSPDRTHAVFCYVQLTPSAAMVPDPFRIVGLDPDTRYRIGLLDAPRSWTDGGRARPPWMARSVDEAEPAEATGAQLAQQGLHPPVLHPESALLVELTRV